uniref:Uncharacterized protein n=1 Tax=Pseudomonas aeruginosa TaxID=287 RepID=A0A7S6G5D8_PSEAI|nr:hypothetical protein [Pseudomonas aeruginosa]QNI17512.1 hypothetical protein [Pseudomonas aeruginosa]WPB12506.1 hypothetical protein XM8_contig2_00072 [Pseudomonas aeruginosa]
MMKSAALPKYRQPQLDENRTLAEQAASSPSSIRSTATARGKGKVVPLTSTLDKTQPGFWEAVPGRNVETFLALFCAVALGVALGIPIGAWIFVSGYRLW